MTDIILIIGFILLGVLVWWLNRGKKDERDDKGLNLIQQQMKDLTETLDKRMGHSTEQMFKSVQGQSSEVQKLIKNITEEITSVKKTSERVFDITATLKDLEKVLKNQKQRGSLGEAGLELILSNILPPGAYSLQHKFQDGDMADAVIKVKDGLIPIDAKFSLDNYNRLVKEEDSLRRDQLEKDFKNDLKKRINETAKYIKPKEGTLPFAIMYIPAEGIYYDLMDGEVGLVNTRNLMEYATKEKKVMIVSPTTFTAFLSAILEGFRAFKIEKNAEEIMKNVQKLETHISAFEIFMQKLGNSLGTTVNHYNTAHKELKKIDKDVLRIAGESPGVDPLEIGKPEQE